jgi:hypothetical protein
MKFWNALLSAFTGAVLALAVMFMVNSFTPKVRADEGGEWVCPAPPAGCAFDGCVHRDTHDCKYIASQKGANCSSDNHCEWKPWIE